MHHAEPWRGCPKLPIPREAFCSSAVLSHLDEMLFHKLKLSLQFSASRTCQELFKFFARSKRSFSARSNLDAFAGRRVPPSTRFCLLRFEDSETAHFNFFSCCQSPGHLFEKDFTKTLHISCRLAYVTRNLLDQLLFCHYCQHKPGTMHEARSLDIPSEATPLTVGRRGSLKSVIFVRYE